MTPPAATAAAPARRAPGPASRPAGAPARRPPLRVVEAAPRHRSARRPEHRRAAAVLSVGMVLASLASVVVGHALLAQGQVRLAGIQAALTTAQAQERQTCSQ